MSNLISRQALLKKLEEESGMNTPEWLVDAINEMPESLKGRWIPYINGRVYFICSECESKYNLPYHFCPNCGVRMEVSNGSNT